MTTKYSPIWEALKKDSKVVLAVPLPLHKRVLRGLSVCKDKDLVFKYSADHKNKRYILESVAEHARITITLKEYDKIADIAVCDL